MAGQGVDELRQWVIETTCKQRKLPTLIEACDNGSERKLVTAIRKAVAVYPEDFLRLLKEKIETDKTPHTVFHVGGPLNHHMLLDYFYFSPLVQAWSMDQMRALVCGLHYYPQLPDVYTFSTADELTVSQCLALMRVTVSVGDVTGTPDDTKLTGSPEETADILHRPDLVDLVLQYPQHGELLARTITERKTVDAEYLRTLIESSVLSLAEGTL